MPSTKDMLDLLTEIEFIRIEEMPGEASYECPSCREPKSSSWRDGHLDDCKLYALKKRLETEPT
jgi:hypothetical protein